MRHVMKIAKDRLSFRWFDVHDGEAEKSIRAAKMIGVPTDDGIIRLIPERRKTIVDDRTAATDRRKNPFTGLPWGAFRRMLGR